MKYGTASDVYSFAICCWELATGEFPFNEFHDKGEKTQTEQFVIDLKIRIVHNHLRPTLLPSTDEEPIEGINCPRAFNQLIQDCWQSNPNDRPSFREILERFKSMVTLSSKQLSSINQLLDQPNCDSLGRTSARISIDFRPLEITSVFRKRAATVRYHREYIKVMEYFMPQESMTPSCAVVVDTSEAPQVWVGYQNGVLRTWDVFQEAFVDSEIVCEKNSIRELVVTDSGHVWTCSEKGRVAIWDTKPLKLVKEWVIRTKTPIVNMQVIRTSHEEEQIWIASPNQIHIYQNERWLHMLNVSEKKVANSCLCQHNNLAWVSVHNEIFLYEIDSLECLGSWAAHKEEITSIISVGERYVWTASGSEITIWESEGHQEIKNVKTLELRSPCSYLYFASMENRVWSSEEDVLLVWDPSKMVPLQEITPSSPLLGLMRSNVSDSLFLLTEGGNLESWSHEIVEDVQE